MLRIRAENSCGFYFNNARLKTVDLEGYFMLRKRKFIVVATLLIIAAVAIVLCVGILTGEKKRDIDGTLVDLKIVQEC